MSGKAMAATIAALAFGCLIAIGVLFATGAQAQEETNCANAEGITAELTGAKYGEKPAVIGTINSDHGPMPFMGFLNDKTGTWTFVARPTEGIGCVIGAGQNWEWVTDAFKPGKPS